MLKAIIQEAAALASLALFIGRSGVPPCPQAASLLRGCHHPSSTQFKVAQSTAVRFSGV
jgi:hypothetical protein